MDVVDSAKRSAMMAGIRSKNTKPEMLVRRFLHAGGFRYRLHDVKLPGRPDVVLPKYRTVIFVNGCFWHQHSGCKYATVPATNRERWAAKFAENAARDASSIAALFALGWKVQIVWECELRSGNDSGRLARLAEDIVASAQTAPPTDAAPPAP